MRWFVAWDDMKYCLYSIKKGPGCLHSPLLVERQTVHVLTFAVYIKWTFYLAAWRKKHCPLSQKQSRRVGRKASLSTVVRDVVRCISSQSVANSTTCSSDWKWFQRGPAVVWVGAPWHAEHTRIPPVSSSPQVSRPHPDMHSSLPSSAAAPASKVMRPRSPCR